MKRRPFTSQAATRVAFTIIIVFVTAQMAWWIYFQVGYVQDVNALKIGGLEREAASVTALLEAGARERALDLLASHPELRLDASGERVMIGGHALEAFLRKQRGVVRMLAFEGPFFVLVVMAGLFIIARNLRLERELKSRQRNFLDAIGHEYRTPVSTLRLMIETLQLRDVSGERRQEYLRAMSTEVNRLKRMGERLLASARLEAGAEAPPVSAVDLVALVAAVLEEGRAANDARGARVELITKDAPLLVNASLDDVRTLVENLVDNAIKYSPEGEARVRVHLHSSRGRALLSVADSGPGIPRSERPRVLERFYRSGDELTRSAKGLGLGLHLVERTAGALGGSVRIGDAASGGALVMVALPLAESSGELRALHSAGSPA